MKAHHPNKVSPLRICTVNMLISASKSDANHQKTSVIQLGQATRNAFHVGESRVDFSLKNNHFKLCDLTEAA